MKGLNLNALHGAILALTALVVGCDDNGFGPVNGTRFAAEEDLSFTVALDDRTEFDLAGINGNVTITGSATADSFSITGIRRVESDTQEDADARLADLQVEVESNAVEVSVRTDQPQSTGGRNYVVHYDIIVPGGVQVSVGNVNGNIDIGPLDSEVVVANVNGNVTLEDIEGDVLVGNANGNIVSAVAMGPGGTIEMVTVNGKESLAEPTGTSANVEIQVGNGSITTSGLALANEMRTATSLTGVLGGGDGTIALGATNGDVLLTGF